MKRGRKLVHEKIKRTDICSAGGYCLSKKGDVRFGLHPLPTREMAVVRLVCSWMGHSYEDGRDDSVFLVRRKFAG